jgi:hypothetical protein
VRLTETEIKRLNSELGLEYDQQYNDVGYDNNCSMSVSTILQADEHMLPGVHKITLELCQYLRKNDWTTIEVVSNYKDGGFTVFDFYRVGAHYYEVKEVTGVGFSGVSYDKKKNIVSLHVES